MATYRNKLPQLSTSLFMTDGGIETDLIFNKGQDLPEFAAFDLLKHKDGKQTLKSYYKDYLVIAKDKCNGFVLEAPTYRANPDWIIKIGYALNDLQAIHHTATELLEDLRKDFETDNFKIPISICIGPRGDGYVPSKIMNIKEAEVYHTSQIKAASNTNADFVSGFTLNYNDEAIGIVNASKKHNIPVVISYTVETDGNLPSGQSLKDAILSLDKMTNNYTSYFMINCAHPEHFKNILNTEESWTKRIKGIRANASKKSHAELDESETLDIGNKEELAKDYCDLKTLLPNLSIIGGCCGTDSTHLATICDSWFKIN
ncbi:homocysteine S-methyltransferase family protein [Mangrovimonas sp. TPBH4]|uniref:homocysteine S-methyltransferase family protein n=1 Tax=Mangrovimonas sp. TPBH4 TaxID=1645914 RepID=UPI0006B62618|nr:homocysteine S-methyltransferase family protein [Mangrovimonas sp. TPBH4]